MEAILNSSFDWNGKRAPYIVATENDALNGAGMLFGHLLTNTAQIFADLRTYWSPRPSKKPAPAKWNTRSSATASCT
jgi:L-fucose/D-arabinose isomerase